MNPLIWSLQFQLLIFSWWTSAMNTGNSSNAALFLYWRPCSWSYAWRSSQKTWRPWVWKVKQTSLTWRWSFRNELGDGWRIGFDWWFGQISWQRFFFWSKSKLLNPLCFVFCFQINTSSYFVVLFVYVYIYIHICIHLVGFLSLFFVAERTVTWRNWAFLWCLGESSSRRNGSVATPVGVCWCSWVRGGGC